MKNVAGLLGWLAITFVAAGLGAIASANAGSFYGQLARPAWAPPGWLFAPVWTLLYLLMGVAAWLVWRERRFGETRVALSIYVVQLAANALWTWLFFAWRQGAAAFGEILVLWALIAVTMLLFWRIRPIAGALLVPYLAWVSFATALTFAVWKRNPGLLG
ncbi:MAG TPA: TspO/MBR family protein [Burkholderiales bacterium]|nr:TspO/MBR family protein [Burkholderiales bacterium]